VLVALLAWLRDTREDLQIGSRRSIREPQAAITIVLLLAGGIGLSVAIFTTANTILRRPLPVLDEQRVVVLWGRARESMRTLPLTLEHFDRFRHGTRALQDVAGTVGIDSWPQPVRDGNETFRINVAPVSGNFFRVLGARLELGRGLAPEDDHAGAAPAAVISAALWRGRFAASPSVLGRRLALRNGKVATIVGVASPGLDYPTGTELWVPVSATWVPEVVPIGRLSPGASAQDAAAELRASFEGERASTWRGLQAVAVPLPALIVGDVRPALLLLSAAAAVLLLTACLNVSNLLLLRGTARQQELAVRRALGAGKGRIVRLLLGETVPLVMLASTLGAWFSTVLLRLLVALAPPSIPRLEEVRLQGVPLDLAIVVSGLATIGSSLVPALWLSLHDGSLLRGSRGATSSTSTAATQRVLVVVQMALAVFGLFVAGLLARTLQSLHAIDTGLDIEHVRIVELSWPDIRSSNETVASMYERLLPELERLPGVTSAATVSVVPFTGATGGWDGRFVVEGAESPAPVLNLAVVGAKYFETMGIGTHAGRTFSASDRQGSVAVAVVSQRAARLLGGEDHILGRRIRFDDAPMDWRTVVGVVPETRYRALRSDAPTVYLPVAQFAAASLVTTIAIKTSGRTGLAIGPIREVVARVDPEVVVFQTSALHDLMTEQFSEPRLNATLLALFATGAIALAVVGLHSVLAASVAARRRELAIRQALGATTTRLKTMVLAQGLGLSAAGLVVGMAAGLAAGRLLDTVLYGVSGNDLGTVVSVAGLLTAASLLAMYWPARQATTPDLTALLRDE
jgi:putative ABC transport system permease protein